MKDLIIKAKKTGNRSSSSLNTFIFYCALLFTFLAILPQGCKKPLKIISKDKTNVIGANQLQQEALIAIQTSLSDKNPLVRARAIEVVADRKLTRLMPKVQRLLQDGVVPVRFAAVLAVGDAQYSLGEKYVRQRLKDRDENVRIAAAYAMGKLGSPKYFKVLCKAVFRSNLTVRANAVMLLGKSGNRNALEFLYWALKNKDSDDRVRLNAIQAIAALGDEQIFPKLWAMRISGYADDRVMAIQALGALGTEKAKNILITMLDDDILEIRLAAAEQLGALGDEIGEPEVLSVFEKNLAAGLDEQARALTYMRTALAIGRIGTPSLKKYLPQLLKDHSASVRLAAAKAVLQCAKAK
jgi:HEAT repeat protein